MGLRSFLRKQAVEFRSHQQASMPTHKGKPPKGTPIILVPPGETATITMWNAKVSAQPEWGIWCCLPAVLSACVSLPVLRGRSSMGVSLLHPGRLTMYAVAHCLAGLFGLEYAKYVAKALGPYPIEEIVHLAC